MIYPCNNIFRYLIYHISYPIYIILILSYIIFLPAIEFSRDIHNNDICHHNIYLYDISISINK